MGIVECWVFRRAKPFPFEGANLVETFDCFGLCAFRFPKYILQRLTYMERTSSLGKSNTQQFPGVDTRGDLVHVDHGRQPSGSVLTDDTEWLQGLLAIAFGDQMLLSLDVKRTTGHKKKSKEEQVHQQMITHRLVPSHSVAMFLPKGVDQEILTTLCRTMCGETPESVVCNEKLKLALLTFKPDDHMNMRAHLQDVPSAVHRLHQFGGGRYKFSVEQEGGTLDLFKPFHPFLLEWEVLAHSTSDSKKRGSTSVRGICDWRNPLGFACHCDNSRREMLGVCASIQGLESGSQAFVAGATVLPLSFLPVLLVSLCPEKWSLRWGVDTKGKVQALKILHYEFLTLPPLTFDGVVLCTVMRKPVMGGNSLLGKTAVALCMCYSVEHPTRDACFFFFEVSFHPDCLHQREK